MEAVKSRWVDTVEVIYAASEVNENFEAGSTFELKEASDGKSTNQSN